MAREYEILQAIEHIKGTTREIYRGIYAGSLPVLITRETHASLQDANQTLNELFTLISLYHPNICKVHDCFIEDAEGGQIRTVLITELLETSLSREIVRRRPKRLWSALELLGALDCLASTLAFAQSKGVAHRDVKPASIYIVGTDSYKFGNFGSAVRLMNEGKLAKTLQGSLLYLSPEMRNKYRELLETQHAPNMDYDACKSDVYSLAVTIIEMALLLPPKELNGVLNNPAVVEDVLGKLSTYELLVPLLQKMLNMDPTQRPSFEDISRETKAIMSQAESSYQSCYSLPNPDLRQLHPRKVLRAEPILCLICEQEVTGLEWRTSASLPAQTRIPDVCSFSCYQAFLEDPNRLPFKCFLCYKSVPPLSLLTVKLPCGHLACRLECLLSNAQRRHDSYFFQTGNLMCIACRQVSNTVQRGGVTLGLQELLQKVVCHMCQVTRFQVVSPICGHQLCITCASGAANCPICSSNAGSLRT
jgi:serine/threonine protein kinase